MKKPLIVANWKLYVADEAGALARAKAIARGAEKTGAHIVICPPALYISALARALAERGVEVGGQSSAEPLNEKSTGDITAAMLKAAGAQYVLVGHSERRAQGETNEEVRALVDAALAAKLSPILCIGESQRDSAGEHYAALEEQMRASLGKLAPAAAKRLVVAYEPVWAIGKSAADAMQPAALEETLIYIRKVLADLLGRSLALATPILYGGSVEADNAAPLYSSGISGFLVGHASVEPASLLAIAKAARSGK